MALFITAAVLGLAALVWSSNRFVHGASALATSLGVPPLAVGLLVVGVGTSAPELVVSALAALDGRAGIAVGNVVGSNIANIGLVVGASALLAPIAVDSSVLRREFPLMFAAFALARILLYDGSLVPLDGAILLAGFAVAIWVMTMLSRRGAIPSPRSSRRRSRRVSAGASRSAGPSSGSRRRW